MGLRLQLHLQQQLPALQPAPPSTSLGLLGMPPHTHCWASLENPDSHTQLQGREVQCPSLRPAVSCTVLPAQGPWLLLPLTGCAFSIVASFPEVQAQEPELDRKETALLFS